MRTMLVLIALFGLTAHSAMAVAQVDMVVVPTGEFMMGSPTGDSDEQPAHKVYVDAFSMDKYEVSVAQYAAFLRATGVNSPADWKTMNQPAHQKRPVANVD